MLLYSFDENRKYRENQQHFQCAMGQVSHVWHIYLNRWHCRSRYPQRTQISAEERARLDALIIIHKLWEFSVSGRKCRVTIPCEYGQSIGKISKISYFGWSWQGVGFSLDIDIRSHTQNFHHKFNEYYIRSTAQALNLIFLFFLPFEISIESHARNDEMRRRDRIEDNEMARPLDTWKLFTFFAFNIVVCRNWRPDI